MIWLASRGLKSPVVARNGPARYGVFAAWLGTCVEAIEFEVLVCGEEGGTSGAGGGVPVSETETLKGPRFWHSVQYQIVPDVGSIHAMSRGMFHGLRLSRRSPRQLAALSMLVAIIPCAVQEGRTSSQSGHLALLDEIPRL